jgi:hypothetical protein
MRPTSRTGAGSTVMTVITLVRGKDNSLTAWDVDGFSCYVLAVGTHLCTITVGGAATEADRPVRFMLHCAVWHNLCK